MLTIKKITKTFKSPKSNSNETAIYSKIAKFNAHYTTEPTVSLPVSAVCTYQDISGQNTGPQDSPRETFQMDTLYSSMSRNTG